MVNKIREWIQGWQTLTVDEAADLTGEMDAVIIVAILRSSLKSLRRRDVMIWAKLSR
jgi:hypothetical protein